MADEKKQSQSLFRALTAEDIEVRVQSANKDGFLLLIYKNARVDQNILDETFGAFGWQDKYEEYKGNLYCSIGIKSASGEWIWKSNCGTESNTEKEKGEASDAFKRAGFNWGIGRELYTSPKIKIKGHTKERNVSFVPEYYDYDVTEFGVEETPIRHISALKIIGKSMEGGYHEDVLLDWKEKKNTSNPQAEKVTTDKTKSEMTLAEAMSRTTAKGKCYCDLSPDELKFIINSDKAAPDSKKAAKLVLDDMDMQPITDDGDLPF